MAGLPPTRWRSPFAVARLAQRDEAVASPACPGITASSGRRRSTTRRQRPAGPPKVQYTSVRARSTATRPNAKTNTAAAAMARRPRWRRIPDPMVRS